MKIGFIGWGTMSEAMISRLLALKLSTPEHIIATGIREERGRELVKRYRISAIGGANSHAIRDADIIVIAVKPKVVPTVLHDISTFRGKGSKGCGVLSIAAGVTLHKIKEGLPKLHTLNPPLTVVRAMPNRLGSIGKGVTLWTDDMKEPERELHFMPPIRSILKALGPERYVRNEDLINKATAVSGSGPAFVARFIRSFIKAAVWIGLPWDLAEFLVIETVAGTVEYLRKTGTSPLALEQEVMTPSGTTMAGDRKLDEGKFDLIVQDAIVAANDRAIELGK